MTSRFSLKSAVRIDSRNEKLLYLLAEEGRASAAQIGRKLRLSREVIGYRLRRLEETGVIAGYSVIPRYKKLGMRQYRVFFLLNEQKKQQHETLLNLLKTHPNTVAVMQYSDTWDVLWKFICEDLDEFDRVVGEITTNFSEVIIDFEKYAVITTYASHMLPVSRRPHQPQRVVRNVVLDESDRKLLAALAQNSRASTYELGMKVGMSSDAIIYRMKRLIQHEYIAGYTPIINLATIGYAWHTYVISFSRFNKTDETKLNEYVSAHPHILRAAKTFGAWDVMLDILVKKPEDYHKTIKEIKNVFADIIRRYESWNGYEELVYNPVPPALVRERNGVAQKF